MTLRCLTRLLWASIATLLLTGCASLVPTQPATDDDQGDRIETLLQVAVTDAETALTLATNANDLAAMQCYPKLIDWLGHLEDYRGVAVDSTGKGVITAYQRTRNIRRRIGTRVPEKVRIACSAMVNDSVGFLKKLIATIGLGG